MPAAFAPASRVARRRGQFPRTDEFFRLDRGGLLLPSAAMAFGGELQARRSIADQAQQLEPGAVIGCDWRPSPAGQGLQDQEFVGRHAHRFGGHNEVNASPGSTLQGP